MMNQKSKQEVLIHRGKTINGDAQWSLVRRGPRVFFMLEDQEVSELQASFIKNFDSEKEFYTKLISLSYDPMDEHHIEFDTIIRLAGNQKNREQINLEEYLDIDDTLLRVTTIFSAIRYPQEDSHTHRRLASVNYSYLAKWALDRPLEYNFWTQFPAHRGCSVNEILDVMDFFSNSEKTLFPKFNKLYTGRIFSVDLTKFDTISFFDLQRIGGIVTSFLQATKRSQKIRKKLYQLNSDQLYRALSYGISGTLLVSDYMDLIDLLKTQDPVNYQDANTYHGSLQTSMISIQANNIIQKENLAEEFEEILSWWLSWWNLVIDDLSRNDIGGLVTYSILTLGATKTLNHFSLIRAAGETISRRGFMQLTRQGGFADNTPVAWQIALLPR